MKFFSVLLLNFGGMQTGVTPQQKLSRINRRSVLLIQVTDGAVLVAERREGVPEAAMTGKFGVLDALTSLDEP